MPDIRIRKARLSDVDYLADNLRAIDRLELAAFDQLTPRESLIQSINESESALIVECDGLPVVIFGLGVTNFATGEGIPWLLATHDLNKVASFVVRNTGPYIAAMHSLCKTLRNWVHADNKITHRWLMWAGFEVSQEVMINGHKFYLFERFQES